MWCIFEGQSHQDSIAWVEAQQVQIGSTISSHWTPSWNRNPNRYFSLLVHQAHRTIKELFAAHPRIEVLMSLTLNPLSWIPWKAFSYSKIDRTAEQAWNVQHSFTEVNQWTKLSWTPLETWIFNVKLTGYHGIFTLLWMIYSGHPFPIISRDCRTGMGWNHNWATSRGQQCMGQRPSRNMNLLLQCYSVLSKMATCAVNSFV